MDRHAKESAGRPVSENTRSQTLWSLASACALFVVALLTAASPAGAACPNEAFRIGASAGLPDCRAYEQVSPVMKNGQPVAIEALREATSGTNGQASTFTGFAAPDGDRLLGFPTGGNAVIDNALRGFPYPFVLERGATAWSARPALDGPPSDVLLNGPQAPGNVLPSADRARLAFKGSTRFSAEQPESPVGTGALANGGVFATDADTHVRWLSKPTSPHADLPAGAYGVQGSKFLLVGGADDLSTIYFMTRQTLTPADMAGGPGNRRSWDQSWALYKVKDGVLSNAGVLPDGTVGATGSSTAGIIVPLDTSTGAKLRVALGAGRVVSRDGDRALFVAQETGGSTSQLFLHRDGLPSLLLSKPESDAKPIAGTTGVQPIGQPTEATSGTITQSRAVADRDLRIIFFATRDALADGAPSDGSRINTYRYEVASGSLEYLPEFDRPSSAPGNVYRVSDDGTRVVFRTPTGELKLWREGLPTQTLMTAGATTPLTQVAGVSAVRFSADGRTVIFMSRQPVSGEPNHPPNISSSLARTQVYRYEETVGGTPTCISCPDPGAAVRGPATFELETTNNGFGRGNNDRFIVDPRAMSDDGRRVYFTTSSTLDPRDQNAVADVYEWSADRGGAVLISAGLPGSRGEYLIDLDSSGQNVFFISEEQLTGSDSDDLADVYDARVGGGLPDPPALYIAETGCALATCQGPPAPAPGAPPLGSALPGSGGNPAPSARPAVGVSGAKTVTGPVAKLRVRVSGAGRISLSGPSIEPAKRSVSREGTYAVTVRLNAQAKRTLGQRKKLKAPVGISYRATEGGSAVRTVTVTFKQPQAKRATNQDGKGGR